MNVPSKLIDAYRKGTFGVFVGAGLSQGCGLPSWAGLLNELIAYAKDNAGLPSHKEAELLHLVNDPSKYTIIAEELREFLHSDLQKYIKNKFDDKTIEPSGTLRKLVNLKYKFIITTNYDTLIEKAIIKETGEMPNPLTYKDSATINYNLWNSETFILKAHGDARSAPSEIVLTEKDYRNIIYKEKGYQSILQVLFSTCNILFLGASLKDPELNLVLSYIHNIFSGGSPDHFALINENDLTSVEVERWRKDFNINIIPYDPHDGHKEVEIFIDNLLAIQ